MRHQVTIAATLFSLLAACSAESPRGSEVALTPEHAAAMRDSVREFLDAYASEISAPPIGKKAQESLGRFYSPAIIMTTDLAPEEPVLVQTLDSLVPPTEIVSQPAWIKSTRFEWGTLVVTPLAPGMAAYSAKYAEHVTDTTGAQTTVRGTQQGVVRREAAGWRIVVVGSSHPMATHRTQEALAARMTPAR